MNSTQLIIDECGCLTGYASDSSHIILPDGVKKIGRRVFFNRPSLKKISLPDSIEEIDEENFLFCDALEYTVSGGAKYLGNEKNPYLVLVSSNEDITECDIEAGCRVIMGHAFEDRCELRRLTVPDSVKYIGFMAFYGCYSLTELKLFGGERICASAFEDCAIEELRLPDTVKSIARDAFSAASLKEVVLPRDVEYIGKDAFTQNDIKYSEYREGYYIGSLDNPYLCYMKPRSRDTEEAIIHKDCRFIYSGAFSGCDSLRCVTLPEGLIQIGDNAFKGCLSLVNINLPERLKLIGACAFSSCRSLKEITLPEGVSIESGAFIDCALESVELIGATVGDNAFSSCEALRSVRIASPCNLYGDNVFSGCTALEEVSLPEEMRAGFTPDRLWDIDGVRVYYE